MSVKPELVAIVAMTENRVIGKDGGMPWHLPADLAHFRRLSVGKPNIMGRKVYDSLGQALPGRTNIVLTRNRGFQAPGCQVVHTPQEALDAAGDAPEIAILGGEEIYRLYLEQLTRVEMTLIHTSLEGDTFFPELSGQWEVTAERERPADEKNRYDLTFRTLIRRS
ncbi:dihydrofolate reductase [Deinococcus deserti]|uniref:Dihydrofolate reductase n=1 Tax=Deinococcus deserti (strain DSM 17065 / CIP 109153 / LMG 22923 / VCD115) TaxID=546414 RepID=C1D068_DEIDV|nr:dihydrofolate reductase [Deinococcus deserti]ACO47337.1 putative dihydrofolate reductase (tetrahydrofolate dehydrogenase) [Deinococcus deserti VCD115]